MPHQRVDLHHARALQQVGADEGAADAPRDVEAQLHELAEARGVVVAAGLGVAKRLQQRVRLQHLNISQLRCFVSVNHFSRQPRSAQLDR